MSNTVTFEDFYQVPDLSFDIDKLRADLDIILKKSKYQTLGITNFAAIPMNQIPKELEFFTDPELEGTPYDAIYGAYPDGRAWTLAPKATDIQLATDLLNYEEDDYYYEDY